MLIIKRFLFASLLVLPASAFGLTVSGQLWNDVNTNGAIDTGETGLAGVVITLYDQTAGSCSSIATDASGNYSFTAASGNSYTLYETANESTPAPATCPPTASSISGPPFTLSTITAGTIEDASGYTSSTANVINLGQLTANSSGNNFGDYSNTPLPTCSATEWFGYLVVDSATTTTASDLHKVDVTLGQSTLLKQPVLNSGATGSNNNTIEGIGYNSLDNYLYGVIILDNDAAIVRIGGPSAYQADVLSSSSLGLPLYALGDVATDGYLYFSDKTLANIRKTGIDPARTDYLTTTTLSPITLPDPNPRDSITAEILDWAFNPVDNKLYGVLSGYRHLVEIDLTAATATDKGKITTLDGQEIGSLSPVSRYGALYFDVNGFLYISGSTSAGTDDLYRLDLNLSDSTPTVDTSKAILLGSGLASATDTDGARCSLAPLPPLDFSDAPASYGAPQHRIDTALQLGGTVTVDAEVDALVSSSGAAGDDTDNRDDEDSVTSNFPILPAGATSFSYSVTVQNNTGNDAFLAGYVDWNADGDFNDAGERSATATVATGTNASVTLNWSGISGAVTGYSYARFRLGDVAAEVESPILGAGKGEVEDYQVSISPTAVSIGDVSLTPYRVSDWMQRIGINTMDNTDLWNLLKQWSPDLAQQLGRSAQRADLLAALRRWLDPDADGQVAVMRWRTLEERGTIGFYVERQDSASRAWMTIHGDMLPGLITAPLGGEYILADPSARPGQRYQYRLVEREASGNLRYYGPYTVEMQP